MPLTARFVPTADEYLGGQIAYNRFLARKAARFLFRYAYPMGALFIAEGVVGFAMKWNLAICLLLAFYGLSIISYAAFLAPRRIKKEFAQYPDHASEKVMEFNEEAVLVQTSHGKSEMHWPRFTRFIETEKLFVLYAPPRFLVTVPKRAIAPNDSDPLRELLKRKLPDIS
jgi:hypothetical protein